MNFKGENNATTIDNGVTSCTTAPRGRRPVRRETANQPYLEMPVQKLLGMKRVIEKYTCDVEDCLFRKLTRDAASPWYTDKILPCKVNMAEKVPVMVTRRNILRQRSNFAWGDAEESQSSSGT